MLIQQRAHSEDKMKMFRAVTFQEIRRSSKENRTRNEDSLHENRKEKIHQKLEEI